MRFPLAQPTPSFQACLSDTHLQTFSTPQVRYIPPISKPMLPLNFCSIFQKPILTFQFPTPWNSSLSDPSFKTIILTPFPLLLLLFSLFPTCRLWQQLPPLILLSIPGFTPTSQFSLLLSSAHHVFPLCFLSTFSYNLKSWLSLFLSPCPWSIWPIPWNLI